MEPLRLCITNTKALFVASFKASSIRIVLILLYINLPLKLHFHPGYFHHSLEWPLGMIKNSTFYYM